MSIFYLSRYAVLICGLISINALAAVREYQLDVAEQSVNLTGKTVQRITINGQFPAPLLEFEEGDQAVIRVRNHLKNQDTSVHWHGLLLPGLMDGVPGFNQYKGIKPQTEFVYRFKVRQSGTYWYHAHSKGQEQDGLYGPLVIYPKNNSPLPAHEQAEQDQVLMLSDFHLSHSDQIMKNLKKNPEYYQDQRETIAETWAQLQREGLQATWQDRQMWNQMRMLRTDLSDVTGYTFLLNGKTSLQNWTAMFQSRDRLRLRVINASAMSIFDFRIPGLKMTVVAADGQPIQPIEVDEFRIGTAETYDLIVQPTADHYQIQAESIDRSGFALGSLQRQGGQTPMQIQLPPARPRATLSMADMGMHEHDEHRDQGHAQTQTSAVQHRVMGQVQAEAAMDHSSMNHTQTDIPVVDHAAMGHVQEADKPVLDHTTMGHTQMDQSKDHAAVTHATVENTVLKQQNSPVVGWANASTPLGHKALQYRDLKALHPQQDTRAPERELNIHLGGSMQRYAWTLNGKKFSEAEPLRLKYGERVRLRFINDSMMAHPMHLHGMFMQLENGQTRQDLPNKHTVLVPPGETVSVLLTADELGEWAIHCHLLYHMSAGMMNKLIVANVDASTSPNTASSQHSSAESEAITSAEHHPQVDVEHHAAHGAEAGGKSSIEQHDANRSEHAREHGGQRFQSTRIESKWQNRQQGPASLETDWQTWWGSDEHKLFLKGQVDKAESASAHWSLEALYSYQLSEFWDLQAGLRYQSQANSAVEQDAYQAVLGLYGMAPYFFETAAYIYLGKQQQGLMRFETERDFLLTQKLIAQPYFNLDVQLHDGASTAPKSGLSQMTLGLESRYEINKRVMPFVQLGYQYRQAQAESPEHSAVPSTWSWISAAGLRLWF